MKIINYLSKIKIKYESKGTQLVRVNTPFCKIIITLFKCIIDEQTIKNITSKNKNVNYYSYFKNLKICLKEMQKIDKKLKLDIIELNILNEFIIIYDVIEHAGKIERLDIEVLISFLIKSLEIIERKDENNLIHYVKI